MAAYVGLLRGVNVGAANRVAMADLRAVLADLGFANVRSLLQSGNLVFEAPAEPAEALERRLEAAILARLGLSVDVFVRTSEEWLSLIHANPFDAEAGADPAHLLLMTLKSAPIAAGEERLRAACEGPEIARVAGRDAYIYYPKGIGDSRLTNAVIDRALGSRGTGRNWNTVLKIAVLAGEVEI